MTVKKTLVSLVSLALTIPLLTACGSGETAESTATGVPTQSTVTSTRSVESSTEEETTTETTEEETVEEPTEEVVEEPAPEAARGSDPGGPLPGARPVEAGCPGGPARRIEQLVPGVYRVETFHQWLRYFPTAPRCSPPRVARRLWTSRHPDQRLADMPMYANRTSPRSPTSGRR